MQDADIFIFGQGVPKHYPKSPEYKLVAYEDITEPCDIDVINLSKSYNFSNIRQLEHAYSEGARIYQLWKNYPLKKYVGTAHYRRYFEFYDNIPNLDDIFAEHDAIFQLFDIGWPSIRANYEGCHNIDDLNMCVKIIKDWWPEYSDAADYVMDNKYFVPCNIFLVTREMFCKWCNFVFGVLNDYNEEMGFYTDLDVCNWVVNHMDKYVWGKGGLPNTSTAYQTRIHAFLMERLSSIFFYKEVKNPYYCDIVLTETNFDFEKSYFKQFNDEKQDISDNSR